jgi:single-stranded-DNA-specific exonuclease
LARDLKVSSIGTMGATQQHIRLQLTDSGGSAFMEAVGFRMGQWARRLGSGSSVDAVFTIGINEWNGTRKVRMYLKDLSAHD